MVSLRQRPKRSKPDDLTVQQVAAELLERPLAMGSRHLRTVLKEDILEERAGYLAASDCPLTREIFRGMARITLKDAATWFQYGASSSLRHKLLQVAAENQRKECAAWLALVACRCLAFLGFGEMVSSSPTQGGGRPVWYFCKRPLSEPRGDASNVPSDAALLTPVLEALGFTATSTPSASAIVTATGKRDNSQPQRASSVAFSPLDPAEVAGRLARLRMLLPEILPEPAHPGEDDVSPTQVASDVASLAGVPLCLVAPADAAQLRVVDVPRVGSCFYSCLHLALAAPAEVMEWHCAHRHPNKAAVDLETWLRFVRGKQQGPLKKRSWARTKSNLSIGGLGVERVSAAALVHIHSPLPAKDTVRIQFFPVADSNTILEGCFFVFVAQTLKANIKKR